MVSFQRATTAVEKERTPRSTTPIPPAQHSYLGRVKDILIGYPDRTYDLMC